LSRSLGQLALFDYTFRVRARFHRFLLMVLMLTLPVQAFAYAAMQGCVLPYQRAAESTEPMAMPAEAMAGCHEAEAMHPAGAPSHSLPAQHECKFCAACGLASAMPIDFAGSTPVVPIAHSFVSQPAASFSGFIPDGPERPPRPSRV
jgi:hypothetical protein